MPATKFLDSYNGQSTEELIQLESEYRVDSLVLAFERGLQDKAERAALSSEETPILAIEALEREVNNGGYSQFFFNSSNVFAGVIVSALTQIGCPKTARITADAIAALAIAGEPTPEQMEAAVLSDDEAVTAALADCDTRYFDNDEPIADRLFEWIKRNRSTIRVGKD